MDQTSARGWKFYTGVALFVYSCATFGLAALVPFLFPAAIAATLAVAVVVSGEIGFWVSAALLGKPFVEALKAKIKALCARRHEVPAPQPISRTRHSFGLVLFTLSFVTYYVALTIPFLGFPQNSSLTAIIVVAVTGELFFAASLFVLGGEFWGRIKALYQWPGQPAMPVERSSHVG